MLDEGNEREELNLDLAFAPRTQPGKEHHVRRVMTEQAKKNSREKRKQAEQEYRARRERS